MQKQKKSEIKSHTLSHTSCTHTLCEIIASLLDKHMVGRQPMIAQKKKQEKLNTHLYLISSVSIPTVPGLLAVPPSQAGAKATHRQPYNRVLASLPCAARESRKSPPEPRVIWAAPPPDKRIRPEGRVTDGSQGGGGYHT